MLGEREPLQSSGTYSPTYTTIFFFHLLSLRRILLTYLALLGTSILFCLCIALQHGPANMCGQQNLLACRAIANLYYAVVSASPGREAYNRATKERCLCTCWNHWTDQGIRTCPVGALVECRRVLDSDVNNCGGCDWRCPAGYECQWGECWAPGTWRA